jgi:hypothetical protein
MKRTVQLDIMVPSQSEDVHVVKICYQFSKAEIDELLDLCRNKTGITFIPTSHLLEILAKHDVLNNVEACGDTYDREYIIDALVKEFFNNETAAWPTYGEGGVGDLGDKESFIYKFLTAVERRGYTTILTK